MTTTASGVGDGDVHLGRRSATATAPPMSASSSCVHPGAARRTWPAPARRAAAATAVQVSSSGTDGAGQLAPGAGTRGLAGRGVVHDHRGDGAAGRRLEGPPALVHVDEVEQRAEHAGHAGEVVGAGAARASSRATDGPRPGPPGVLLLLGGTAGVLGGSQGGLGGGQAAAASSRAATSAGAAWAASATAASKRVRSSASQVALLERLQPVAARSTRRCRARGHPAGGQLAAGLGGLTAAGGHHPVAPLLLERLRASASSGLGAGEVLPLGHEPGGLGLDLVQLVARGGVGLGLKHVLGRWPSGRARRPGGARRGPADGPRRARSDS